MIDIKKVHEKEIFTLILPKKLQGQQAIIFFKSIGLALEDDFFYLDRKKPEGPWQSISIITIDSFFNNDQVYPDESAIDRFIFSYLFASLPESCFGIFKDIIEKSAIHFSGKLEHNFQHVSLNQLDFLFNQWKEDLENELAEKPGTESLGILIQELFYQ